MIKTTKAIEPSYFKKRFSTFNNAILQLKQWLLENDFYNVYMESTGKYWVPIYNLLEDVIAVTIANPKIKWVRAVKGNKDDVKDSKWIGDLFRLGIVPGSFVPEKTFAFSVSIPVIGQNLFRVSRVKKIAFKTLSPFVM